MKNGSYYKVVLLRGFAALLAVCLCTHHWEPVWADTRTTKTAKTRTELLNELSLRTAQVVLEHAEDANDRYGREYENAKRLFDQSIISKKELDEALSAFALAQQQLKQARIELEKTKLGFLRNATHITIMEAKKYYDSEGQRMLLDLVLKNNPNQNGRILTRYERYSMLKTSLFRSSVNHRV
jgi:multidrug resistance efflux pump